MTTDNIDGAELRDINEASSSEPLILAALGAAWV
jgi:hypothetical protein